MRLIKYAALGLPLAIVAFTAAHAQQLTPGGTTFTGGAPDRPGCPAVKIHLTRSGQSLAGFAYYADGSGVSRLEGRTDGRRFSWDQTNWSGKGPTGHVDGTINAQGNMHVQLVGTNCSFDTVLPLYNDYGGGGSN